MLEPIHTLPSLAVLISMSIIGVSLYANVPTQALILFFFVPLGLLSLFGAYKKNDLKIFPYLFIVIPAQIIGYGIGFIFNFIKRYIFHQKTWTGFRKKYYD